MKDRIFLVLIAVMLTLSVGLTGCGGEETPEYSLTISSSEGGKVTTPGEGSFVCDEGMVVDLVAEADDGYHFVSWTGLVGTIANVNDATTTIDVDNHYSITANFASDTTIPFKNPGTFVQMIIEDVASLDPAWGYDLATGEQVGYIYETLVYFDGTQTDEFVPVLATEWELLDDNLTYRFKIRDGVKFHEGGDLTPEDVEYSFERTMVQDRGGGPTWMLYQSLLGLVSSRDGDGDIQVTFDEIDNAVEVDGDWVVFHMIDPSWGLIFLQILSEPMHNSITSIVDKEWCVANGEWNGTEETWQDYNAPDASDSYLYDHTNGTGPWKLEEWNPGVQIKLVRNDDYWREPAPFEMIITKVIEDWTTRKEALLAGDADLVQATSPWTPWKYSELEGIGDLDSIADLNIYEDLPAPWPYALFFNMNIASDSEYIGSGALDGNGIPTDFFSDADVRKGLCYAFDYEAYIEDGWLGQAHRLGSPVCDGLPYFNPDASMYSLDLAKAEEHLRAAWGGQVWQKGFKFTLLYDPDFLRGEPAWKILAENLYAINPEFQISIQPTDWSTGIRPSLGSRVLPMFYSAWAGDWPHPDNVLVPFMASYAAFAYIQGYGYPELDELIENALKEPDPGVQQGLYYDLQERYYEDAPGIMLCQPLWRRYFTKYIHGFYFNPFIPGQPGPLYYMSKSES